MTMISRRNALGLMAAVTIPPTVVVAVAAVAPQDDPLLLAMQAAQRLADAMELVSPGGSWKVVVDHDTRCAIIIEKNRGREKLV
ncbi:hypothetical protein OE766_03765 [Pararhizobium sp. YC-54]|uniref:hypothetical protein n=1 Tax=Pararhizobium sp. YC-54 TaxID=2986920 RepID=UPI0021F77ED7|nr:hypothetical protein [Pararhizobium sp. YC-54]MCV9997355.1 hypothetical protein [Pararhizobium sp. YC-54]